MKAKTKDEIRDHKNSAISRISRYLTELIDSNNLELNSKADKIAYWLEEYSDYLRKEKTFSPQKLISYKRGSVISVNLGFNVGSEEGGLHYAVVVEKNNSIHNPVVTVVPLTSIKPTTDINNLKLGNVNLGNELYEAIKNKSDRLLRESEAEKKSLQDFLDMEPENRAADEIKEKLKHCKNKIASYRKTLKAISKMKQGSIALVNQITTVSKLRIYDPKNSAGVLSQIKLSDESLNKIDTEILKCITGVDKSGSGV